MGDRAEEYPDFAKERYVGKSYSERRPAFVGLFESVNPEMPVQELTQAIVIKNIQVQHKKRSGYAANKDRKNLVAAHGIGG